ncbi:zinc ribbon domain-containing protein [Paenibacillus thermoaerophilus]|uniref:Zinc ribbon domain-containing protein n=1 Tax=Paenibacillus thermoaerophilus TaxID=1215385 RepID=A0ABW2V3W2_9BACL|nr:zinc ribbon domain-containing protein [Paenibacillus thermoaerophilus]TMV11137.1 hypothetical protein FE781_12720 [Paenibacillus thermoaerophilus]
MSLFKKIKESALSAADKAQQTVEITRIHAQISGKEKEIANLYQQLGKRVFDAYVTGDLQSAEPNIAEYSGKVIEIQKEIEVLKQKIREIKNEKQCECGTTVPADALFCSSCGRKLETPAKEPQSNVEGADDPALCAVCKNPLEAGAKFCVHCGTSQAAAKEGIGE